MARSTIALFAFLAGTLVADYTYPSRYWEEDEALCGTDTECMELCPEGSWNLRWRAAVMPNITHRRTVMKRDYTDAELLDFLEKEANDDPLLLHSLPRDAVLHGFRGLGLKCTGRSLRKAIADMMYATPDSPPGDRDK